MGEEILDEVQHIRANDNSRLSVINFGITAFLLFCIFVFSAFKVKRWPAGMNYEVMETILSFAFLISTISGLGFALRSLIKKERKSMFQKINIVGNIIIFSLLFFLTIAVISEVIDFI